MVETKDNGSELMLAFKNGDGSGFNQIVRLYKKPVLNIIYRFIGSSSDAEDLAQEVFVKVYKSKDRYYAGAKFSTWLYRIASNLCISYLRRRKILNILSLDAFWQEEGVGGSAGGVPDIPDSAEINPETAEIMREEHATNVNSVRKALAGLPAKQRLAVIYRYYNDYSYEEIAEVLNTSLQSVKSLLFRANFTLKGKLISNEH